MRRGYSLYVGIPFCPTTCLYCSFTSYPIGAWEKKVHLYLEALFKELDYVAEKMKGRTLDTVYFGGGTPTSLKAEELDALLTKIENTFDLSKVPGIHCGSRTSGQHHRRQVQSSPCPQYLQDLHQSADDEAATLDLIGRHHTVDMVKEKFRMARDLGFDNINMDLIIGLPEEGYR